MLTSLARATVRFLPSAALVAVMLAVPAAAAAAPPERPLAPSLDVIERPARVDIEALWIAESGLRYRIEWSVDGGAVEAGATPTTTTLRARIIDVEPGARVRVRVVAASPGGEESLPSQWAAVSTPRLETSVVTRLRSGGRPVPASRCGAAAKPCDVEALAGWALRIATSPRARTGTRPVWIERRARRAGQRRWSMLRTVGRDVVDSTGVAVVPLLDRTLRVDEGTYCVRAAIRGSAQLVASRSAWRCLHVRPPVLIGWAGDITLGSRAYGVPPANGAHVFDGVRRLLQAPDLMIGNYEGTLSRGGRPRCSGGSGCFIFQAPPRNARALADAGFDVMNLANNHGLDMGESARRETVAALDRYGVEHAGLPGSITLVQVRETRVAIVGFAHSHGTMHLRDRAAARALVRRAGRAADVVVVAMHAGKEGAGAAHVPRGDEYAFGENRGNTRAFVHAVIDAGADLVVGSGPHVVRGVERRRGRLAFYSTGNFAGWNNFNTSGGGSQSGVVHVRLSFDGELHGARWNPVRLDGPGLPVRGGRSIIRRVASLTRTDFPRSGARIAADGSIS